MFEDEPTRDSMNSMNEETMNSVIEDTEMLSDEVHTGVTNVDFFGFETQEMKIEDNQEMKF